MSSSGGTVAADSINRSILGGSVQFTGGTLNVDQSLGISAFGVGSVFAIANGQNLNVGQAINVAGVTPGTLNITGGVVDSTELNLLTNGTVNVTNGGALSVGETLHSYDGSDVSVDSA